MLNIEFKNIEYWLCGVVAGECGLDGFYLTDPVSLVEQERVLRLMCAVCSSNPELYSIIYGYDNCCN